MDLMLTIEELGHQGDGLATTASGRIAVPFTLPGETVRARLPSNDSKTAELLEVMEPSSHRISPVCPHFTICGGCQLQHLDQEMYSHFKRQKILGALAQQELNNILVKDPVFFPSHSRRRVGLKAAKRQGKILLGYYRPASHTIVDVKVCPLVVPEIEALFVPLRSFLVSFLEENEKIEVLMTRGEPGLDVVLKINKKKDLELDQRQVLIEFARTHDLARLSLHQPGYQEVIVSFRDPFVLFDGVRVSIDASSFLQVNKAMDEMLSSCLQEMLPAAFKYAADLFCGRGTLSLPLSRKGPVDSFEMDEGALKALLQAAKNFRRPLSAFSRNLFSSPLRKEELKKYDVVVLNPPRIGAHAQAKELAQSSVLHVFVVSCNSASFARDARVLIEGGYHLNDVTPLDQFSWSPHIEMVAVFKKT